MRTFFQAVALFGIVMILIVVTQLPKNPVQLTTQEVTMETQKVFVTDEHVHITTQQVDLQEVHDKLDMIMDIVSSQLEEKG